MGREIHARFFLFKKYICKHFRFKFTLPMETSPHTRHLRDLPPRQVGLFAKAVILFSGFMQQFGWIFFVMGSLFAWIFIPASTVRYWFEGGKDWKEVPGKVVSAEPTNSAVNEETVYRYLHSFEVNGQRYTGKSFTAGQDFQGGEEVTIRYDAKAPGKASYIQGSDRAVFPAFVLFILIFPFVGLVFIINSLRQNAKAIRLLEIGEFARGSMCSKEATNTTIKINNTTYPVFKYTFEFEAEGRTRNASCKTHQAWLVEDEQREIILYDKYNPDFNIVYDATANMPSINEQGTLEAVGIGKVVYLVLPLMGLAIHLLFWWYGAPFTMG
jgi:hypothetical protein